MTLGFSFGYSLSSTPAGGLPFFVHVNNLTAGTHASAANENLGLHIGFLGAQVAGGDIELDDRVKFHLFNPSNNPQNTLTLSDLQQYGPADLGYTQGQDGALKVTLPVTAQLDNFSTVGTTPVIYVTDTNLFSGSAPDVSYNADFGQLLPFTHVSAADVLMMFQQIDTWVNKLGASLPTTLQVPFAQNVTTNGLFRFDQAFYSGILAPLTSQDSSTPVFATAQDMIGLISSAVDGANYNPTTGILTFDLNVEKIGNFFTAPLDLSLSPLPLLNMSSSSSTVTLTPKSDLRFTFGIDLIAAADPIGPQDYFVRDTQASGTVSLSVPNIVVTTGQFGFLGITVSGVSGTSTMTVTLQGLEGQLYVDDPLPTITPVVSGSSDLLLDNIQPKPSQNHTLAVTGSPTIVIVWDEIGDPSTLHLVYQDMDQFECYQYLAYQDAVNTLTQADNFLQQLASYAPFAIKLPMVGKNVAQLVPFAADFDNLVQQIKKFPGKTIQDLDDQLSAAFGGNVQLDVTDICHYLGISIQYQTNHISADLPIALSLPQGSPANALVATSPATVHFDSYANLNLDLGIDTTDHQNLRPFLFDTSSVTLNVSGHGNNLNFKAGIGPLNVSVQNGFVAVDADGNPGTSTPATFTASLKNDGSGRHYFSELVSPSSSLIQTQTVGVAKAVLPLYIGNTPLGDTTDDNNPKDGYPDNDLGLVVDFTHGTTQSIIPPNLSSNINTLDLLSNLSTLEDGLDGMLDTLANLLSNKVLGLDLPLVGTSLKDALNFVKQAKQKLDDELNGVSDASLDELKNALFKTFGPDDLNWLVDANGNPGTIADVKVPTSSSNEVDFSMKLAPNLPSTQVPFDLGLPALGLTVNGNVSITPHVVWNLGFGISKADGFYLTNSQSAPELIVSVDASIPGFVAQGSLGLLTLDVKDSADPRKHTLFNPTFTIDLVGPNPKITAADITSGNFLDAHISGDARINLDLSATFGSGDNTYFPSIGTTLSIDWNFGTGVDTDATGTNFGVLSVTFADVHFDAGQLVTSFIKPAFDHIKGILTPVEPVIDFLTKPLPILSDIDGLGQLLFGTDQPIMVDVIAALTGNDEPKTLVDTLKTVLDVVQLVDSFAGGGSIHEGDFTLGDPRAANFKLSDAAPSSVGPAPDNSGNSAVQLYGQMKTKLNVSDRGFSSNLLDDPTSALRLLLGQKVDLLQYEMPLLDGSVDWQSPDFPIFPPFLINRHRGQRRYQYCLRRFRKRYHPQRPGQRRDLWRRRQQHHRWRRPGHSDRQHKQLRRADASSRPDAHRLAFCRSHRLHASHRRGFPGKLGRIRRLGDGRRAEHQPRRGHRT